MITIAHLSDVHLGPLPGIRVSELLSKRITGYLNWKLNRARYMHPDTLNNLVNHMKTQSPDFVAITGDMMNLSTRAEVIHAAEWLQDLESHERCCVVPGNHDAYVRRTLSYAANHWGPYMHGDGVEAGQFPFLRRAGEAAIIGCSSALATPPFYSNGRFGESQASRLAEMLKTAGEQGLFRVVLIHHPPIEEYARAHFRGLRGASTFRRVIAEHGAELILHGHLHRSMVNALPGPDGEVPVIGVAAASSDPERGEQPARYNLFSIERLSNQWSCVMHEFGYRRIGDDIVMRLQMRIY